MKNINFILATNEDNVIGLDNKIPWHVKEDLQNFKKLTLNNMVIMGYYTFSSLNFKPLSERLNIVITSKYENYKNESNLIFLSSVNNAIQYGLLLDYIQTIWIIGGRYLYEQIHIIKPNEVYLTLINHKINNPDAIKLSNNFFEYLNNNYSLIESNDIQICKFNIYKIKNIEYKSTNIISEENNYLNLLKNTIRDGDFRMTRNDYTWSIFGPQIEFDISERFPLLTSKKLPFKMIFEELMFFINGFTDNKILKEKNIHIWDANTTTQFLKANSKTHLLEDDMGPMYGFQWRHFNTPYDRPKNRNNSDYYKLKGIDQLEKVINELKTDPFSRRILLTTFNPSQVEQGVLYPCHSIVLQFYCRKINDNIMVSVKMYQRSADLFLGLPFNIASTALFLYLICNVCGDSYKPDKMIITLGDAHIYQSHIDAVLTQLQSNIYTFPKLNIKNRYTNIEEYKYEDIELLEYKSDRIIKAKMIA